MTIGITARQGKRWGLLAMAATIGCWGATATSHAADGPSIFNRKPSGPIFKTLDAFAGGIELVLENTVLGHSKSKSGCDAQVCDDGCDAILLHELSMPQGSKLAVPEAYQTLPPPPSPMHSTPPQSLTPMIEVEPTFDRPTRKTLPQPMPETPADVKTQVQKKSLPNLSNDDGWIDSFAPSTPNPDAVPPRRGHVPAKEPLSDPFQDDPQTRATPQRFSPSLLPSETSYTTRSPVVRAVKPVNFEQ
jgi:hypothetical protein